MGIVRYRTLPPSPYSDRDARSMIRRLVAVGTPESHILLLQGRRTTKAELEGIFSRGFPDIFHGSRACWSIFLETGHLADLPDRSSFRGMPAGRFMPGAPFPSNGELRLSGGSGPGK